MRFECINEQYVELKIIGYEYPKITDDPFGYDSNWLMVYINAKSAKKHWEAVDPAFLSFELKELIDWLNYLSENRMAEEKYGEDKSCRFCEPCLAFKLMNNYDSKIKKIKIIFGAEFHPQKNMERDYSITFMATNERLKYYANELEYELQKYPIRSKNYIHYE